MMHQRAKHGLESATLMARCGLAIACVLIGDVSAIAQQGGGGGGGEGGRGGRPQAQPVRDPNAGASEATQPATQPAEPAGNRPGATRPSARPGQPGAQPNGSPRGNAGQPAASPAGGRGAQAQPAPAEPAGGVVADSVMLSQFAEPVELKALVEYVADTLQINVVGSDALSGTVVINAPMTVPKDELLALLAALLEQQGFTIVLDQSGFYRILEANKVQMNFTPGELSTTRLIATPTLKPSSLQDAVNKQFGDPQSGQMPARVAYLDDLGIIVITDTPRRVKSMEDFIARILEQKRQQTFQRFELDHVSATTARQRAIELIGQVQPSYGQPGQPGMPMPVPMPGGMPAASLNNLAERLTVDAQGNALIFRGTEEESVELRSVLNVIDVPSTLEVRAYFAGSAASEISKIASGFGLGSVQQIDTGGGIDPTTGQPTGPMGGMPGIDPSIMGGGAGSSASSGGPTMVVDIGRGRILYYGTPTQHATLGRLIKLFDTDQDAVAIEFYKLKNAKAEEVSELLNGILTNQAVSANNALLQGGGFVQRNRGRGRNRTEENFFVNPSQQQNFGGGNRGDSVRLGAGEDVFVLADVSNNQVIVKAPQKLQSDFEKLITKLDLRKPQVYIEAQIVAISATDDFRLAFETQLINAQGTGGVINTNFGLGTFGSTTTTAGNILSPKTVASNLAGFTGAIIKSDQVPIIINALARQTSSRILSTPQILVDNNEEAEIVSLEEQPTTSTTVTSGNPTQTAFAGYEEAGTSLLVTPQISEGNYVRLDYEIELSSFIGSGSDGVPPPKQTNRVNSDSVTVPSDQTVVIGGFELKREGKTVVKVPLLGDIPILGQLFKDDNKNNGSTRLYVFLTPRILRDPNFRDLILLTQGPQLEAKIDPYEPSLEAQSIDLVEPILPSELRGLRGVAPSASPPDASAPNVRSKPSDPLIDLPGGVRPGLPATPASPSNGQDPTAWASPQEPPRPGQIKRPQPK
jgi:type II secretory pathway component GspD/PulD (secretin)